MFYRGLLLCLGSLLVATAFGVLRSENAHFDQAHWLIHEQSCSDLPQSRPDALIVDARRRDEFDAGHIPGALSLDAEHWDEALPDFLGAWSPERPVVIYCGGQACGLSKEVALKLLHDLPEARVYVLKGGYPAWQAQQALHDNPAL